MTGKSNDSGQWLEVNDMDRPICQTPTEWKWIYYPYGMCFPEIYTLEWLKRKRKTIIFKTLQNVRLSNTLSHTFCFVCVVYFSFTFVEERFLPHISCLWYVIWNCCIFMTVPVLLWLLFYFIAYIIIIVIYQSFTKFTCPNLRFKSLFVNSGIYCFACLNIFYFTTSRS